MSENLNEEKVIETSEIQEQQIEKVSVDEVSDKKDNEISMVDEQEQGVQKPRKKKKAAVISSIIAFLVMIGVVCTGLYLHINNPYNKLEKYLSDNGGKIVKEDSDEALSLSMDDDEFIIKVNRNSILENRIANISFSKDEKDVEFSDDNEILFVTGYPILSSRTEGDFIKKSYNKEVETVNFDECDMSGTQSSRFSKDDIRETTLLQINSLIDFLAETLKEANIGVTIKDLGFEAYTSDVK